MAHMKTSDIKTSFVTLKVAAALVAICGLTAALPLNAQNGPPPDFDPAQMRQRMLEHLRQQFDVSDDSEWKVISERVQKVMEARRGLGGPGGPGGFGGFGPGGGPPPPAGGPAPDQNGPSDAPHSNAENGQAAPRGPGAFNRPSSPELEALRKAVESKASASDLKARLDEFRAARKQKEADLEKAQADLKQILSARQEAVAVMFGLLK